LYAVYNRENHIFQARQASARNYPVPESVPNFKFPSQDLLQKLEEKEIRTTDRITYAALHQRLLEQYAPPSVVIDETYDIVHMSEKVGKYFQVSGGEPTQNVLKLVRPELRLEMRAALYQAVHQQASIETRDLKLMIDGQTKTIHLHIRPVIETGDTAKGFILIIFQETVGADNEPALIQLSTEPMAIQLEEELVRIQGQLRTSTEQYEFQAEELKASNEELQAMNEELRSAAEELETSKEELQSINEELRTVNQELKVKVEESAHVSNNFQNLINSAEVGTIFLDRSFRIKFFTPSIKNLFNLITTDFGRPITDITNKLNYPDLLNDAEIVLEKLAIQEREINSVDGRAFMMRLLPYRTDDRINGVVITFFDITQRRQAEEALRQSEEHLRLLIESASDYAIFTLDRERRVLTWSKGAEAMMGYTEQEIIGKPADIVFTAEDRLQHAPEVEIEKAEQEGRAKNERWHVRKDGSKFWGSGSVSSLRNNDGNLVGLVKIMRDLTEARKLEAAKFFLASIVESSQDPIFTMNFDSQITSWNKAAENMYGYREEEVLGKHVSMITLPQNLEKAIEDNKTIQHSGEVKVFDSVRVIKGDIELQVQVMLSPVKNAEEQVIGISAISRDITEQKHFMEELARQVNQRTLELQRSNDDLLQFAHVASHDLKEPVRKILTFNNRLADEFNHLLPEKARMYIDKINHSAERMNSMIEGILNYSSSKNEHHIFENVDINKIIEQIESELELLIRKKNGVVNKPQLPGIKGISVLVYQLFYNLINNALKFSKANEPAVIDINYDFEKRDDKEFFKITLSDNGIGFEPEFKNRIFEIFTRLNTKDEFEGTGIGLALCKKIMERHGGHIYATSELGQGATFILLFPH
ncbi:MAG TPA: PAS domain S-box protein, partial [Cyclobacteriaceae bacterium]